MHAFRGHRRPVSGKVLADAIGISIRALYRDIASLQALGAAIEGEPGVGYILKPGFLLPPLMFTPEEIEALLKEWRKAEGITNRPDHSRTLLTRRMTEVERATATGELVDVTIERGQLLISPIPSSGCRTGSLLNKGESRNALARAIFFNRLGELRDRTFENQRHRASGLTLVAAAVTLWNTVYLD